MHHNYTSLPIHFSHYGKRWATLIAAMTWRDSLPRSIRTFVVSFSDFLHSLANFIFRASSYSVVPWMHIELEENHLMIYDVNSLVRVDVPIFSEIFYFLQNWHNATGVK